MKLQILNEEAEYLAHAQATLPHEQNDTTKLEIVDSLQECLKICVFHGLDALLRLFEFDNPLHGFSTTGMHEEQFEATETIGNLLVEHRIGKRFPSLDVIAIEAANGCDNGIDASLTERTGTVNGKSMSLTLWITEPLDKGNQVIGSNICQSRDICSKKVK